MSNDITNSNKIIAQFMGATVDKIGRWKIPNVSIPYQGFEEFGDCEPCLKFNNECYDWEMKYHNSWDWLMPVIDKIELEGYYISITKSNITCCKDFGISPIFSYYFKEYEKPMTKLYATWFAVIEFIKSHDKKQNN